MTLMGSSTRQDLAPAFREGGLRPTAVLGERHLSGRNFFHMPLSALRKEPGQTNAAASISLDHARRVDVTYRGGSAAKVDSS